jgi:hypothetical protein
LAAIAASSSLALVMVTAAAVGGLNALEILLRR